MAHSASRLPVALPPSVRLVEGAGGLPRLDVVSRACSGQVYLHGAHVAAWQPVHASAPVLWLSAHSAFAQGKPIRGGVPVCFPWFGPHPSGSGAPAHGFARLMDWTLIDAGESDEAVTLAFLLPVEPAKSAAWPWGARVEHRVSFGARLSMELRVTNTDARPFRFEEALHTYFSVGGVERTAVTGLEGSEYLDKVQGGAPRREGDQPVRFRGETDRIYQDARDHCVIHDPHPHRRIIVAKSGSASTVVWNPWSEKARRMPDFGDAEWRGMVCVETANVGGAAVSLQPGESHAMSVAIDAVADA